MELTKLETLLITEISGVDDPANELPGWMVTKAVGRKSHTVLDFVRATLDAATVEELGLEVRRDVVKKRHTTRAPQGTYQADEPTTETLGGWPVKHGGAVHPALRRMAAEQARARAAE